MGVELTEFTESSYRQGACAEPLRGLTIGAALEDAAHRFPGHEALVSVHQGLRYTYAELDAEVDACANGLMGLGVGPGDRVALWSPNCAEWAVVQYATAKIGAVLVSVNPAYRSDELAYLLAQSGSRVLISAQRHKSSDYPALVEQARDRCPDLDHVLFLESEQWTRVVESGRERSTDDLRRCSAGLSFDDPINIQYTSGTTGSPKGATLTHHGLLNNGYFVGVRCGFTDQDRICVPVPYYHCFGMVLGNLAALAHGACVVLPGASFEPAATLQAVQQERCTALYGLPTMFVAELALPDLADRDLSSLRDRGHRRGALLGGADGPDRGRAAPAADDRGLRHDRDLPDLHPDLRRRLGAPPDRDGRDRPPAHRSGRRRPRRRASRPARV